MVDNGTGYGHARLPTELASLLRARDGEPTDEAWDVFLARYSRLILRVAHERSAEYDGAMDRYAWVLERLREDDFRRLRRYVANEQCKFSTWLVVVLRRLAEDFQRQRYGRTSNGQRAPSVDQIVRRRLADMLVEELDCDLVADPVSDNPEMTLRRQQLLEALRAALGKLDPEDHLLLSLRFEDGLRAREIAGILSLPSAFHVYRRVNSGLSRLRTILERQGIDGAQP